MDMTLIIATVISVLAGIVVGALVQSRKTAQLEARLGSAQDTVQRLSDELTENRQIRQELEQRLDLTREQQHAAEKQFEAAKVDARSLGEQARDLRDRLASQVDAFQQLLSLIHI